MLQNASLLAKIGADTAENEQSFAEILPKICNYPTGQRADDAAEASSTTTARTSCQFLAKFRQNVARFRLYRHRFLQENMRFAAFFKIYQII